MSSILCPGFAVVLRSNGSLSALAVELGISNSALYRANDVVLQRLFDLLFPKLKVLWNRNFCNIDERPRNTGPRKANIIKNKNPSWNGERDYGSYRISTPHLAAFNGVEGGFY